ncbi:MAG: hypothetical protein GWN31_03930, partial [Candidatus Thorarchaeota archaeon]|nr:hypothetical protein [Candidatus Thorarchaeota archaeon]NIW13082.1 hypothetical protein [Candidatus Thorarchaeota archaeon]NIW51244.1 hypothetical protein [Candidatus Korarchaeota archaeon]
YYVGKRSPLHRKRSKKSRRKKEREARRWAAGMTAGAGALGAGVQMLTNRHTKKKYKHYSDEDLKKVIEKHPELTSGYEDFHKK